MGKLEQELEEAKLLAKEKQTRYKNCISTVSELEKAIGEHGNQREFKLKDLDKRIKSLKSDLQSARKLLKVILLFAFFNSSLIVFSFFLFQALKVSPLFSHNLCIYLFVFVF